MFFRPPTPSCSYVCVLCFNNVASGFIAQKWLARGLPIHDPALADARAGIFVTANAIMLTTYLVAACLAPFLGAIIDRVGMRAALTAGAAALIVGVHATLAFTDIYPVGPLIVLGICYSVYASALWPSVALITQPRYHAMAYGVVTAVQNLGQAAVPLGAARARARARAVHGGRRGLNAARARALPIARRRRPAHALVDVRDIRRVRRRLHARRDAPDRVRPCGRARERRTQRRRRARRRQCAQ
jgi:hypothetical protein